MHPNGQLPAYEWDFGDVNPPVHAWAALRVLRDRRRRATATVLERVFHKLLLNFTWWVNARTPRATTSSRAASSGSTTSVRSTARRPCPTGSCSSRPTARVDGDVLPEPCSRWRSCWPTHDPAYEDVATKFFEHFALIAAALNDTGLWDEDDGFYYDRAAGPPTAPRGRCASARSSGCSRSARSTLGTGDDGRALPELRSRVAVVPEQPARDARRRAARERRPTQADAAGARRSRPAARDCSSALLDDEEFLSPTACARCRAATATSRSSLADGEGRRDRRLRAGRVDDAAVRRQLELARAGLVPDQLPADRVARALRTATSATASRSSARPARASSMTLDAGRATSSRAG